MVAFMVAFHVCYLSYIWWYEVCMVIRDFNTFTLLYSTVKFTDGLSTTPSQGSFFLQGFCWISGERVTQYRSTSLLLSISLNMSRGWLYLVFCVCLVQVDS